MRVLRLGLIMLGLFCTSILAAQTAAVATPPTRDTQAVSVLNAAAIRLGSNAISPTTECIFTGTLQDSHSQGQNPETIVWKTLGGEIRVERSGGPVSSVFVSGYGNPQLQMGTEITNVPLTQAQAVVALHFPALALTRELNDSNYTLTMTPSPANLQNVVIVHSNNPVEFALEKDWYIDTQTGLPFKVAYAVPRSSDVGNLRLTLSYGDFRSINGTLFPFYLIRTNLDSGRSIEIRLQTVQCGTTSDASQFQLQ